MLTLSKIAFMEKHSGLSEYYYKGELAYIFRTASYSSCSIKSYKRHRRYKTAWPKRNSRIVMKAILDGQTSSVFEHLEVRNAATLWRSFWMTMSTAQGQQNKVPLSIFLACKYIDFDHQQEPVDHHNSAHAKRLKYLSGLLHSKS